MIGLAMGLGLSQPTVASGSAPVTDDLATSLAALEAAGKLVCAWFLPLSSPSSTLTLSGTDVNGWTASYGTQKVNLAVETAAPQWDATLYSNKGGVTFNGTDQRLLSTDAALASWPDATSDLYMLVAVRNDSATGLRSAFAYGTNSASRFIGKTTEAPYAQAALTTITGTATTIPNGSSHVLGGLFDIGGTSLPYLDGAASGAGASTATAALTLTRVRLGANANSTATQFWQGVVVCAAILNSTASLSDFTSLSALMQARLS